MPATVWKGYLSFGLVSFPIRLFAAARAEAVHFHMLHKKDLSRVKEVWYCAEEDKPIDRSEMVKGYEAQKGQYIVVEDDELKKIAPPTATTMDIVQFVTNSEVDPILFERSYYVAPDEKVTKPYVLFLKALKETKYSAIAKVSMHGREDVVLIRAADKGLVLHTLYYADELNSANQASIPAGAAPSSQELTLARNLIQQLAKPFKLSEFHDTYRENVETLIEQKAKGKKVTSIQQPRRAPVIDLMDALKRSLKSTPGAAQSRKPRKRKVA
jgi:DNA end-binding protein Ku